MLRSRAALCVLHVADAADEQALETLCRITRVVAGAGAEQVLLVLTRGAGSGVIWSAALPAEVRPIACPRPSLLAPVKALRAQFARLSRERPVHAVHLHGLGPCLLGSLALKGSALRCRVLYSPHLGFAAPWAAALLGRLLQADLQALGSAAVTASPLEAPALSRLLNRSADVLPHPVSPLFFAGARQERRRPRVLADGGGARAADIVSRLSVLLNARAPRVPIFWMGAAEPKTRAQLEAAGVRVLALADEAARAHWLSQASAFIHIAASERLPLAVAQAMAAGVPCLACDTPAHRALLRHGESGFICTSERDFLEKLVLLLRDAAERRRVGEGARADAERCFAARNFEQAILRVYGFSLHGAFSGAGAPVSSPVPDAR